MTISSRAYTDGDISRLQDALEAATVEFDASNDPARALYAGVGFVKRYETSGFRRLPDR